MRYGFRLCRHGCPCKPWWFQVKQWSNYSNLCPPVPVLRSFKQYFIAFCTLPESASDAISDSFVRLIVLDKYVKYRDPCSRGRRASCKIGNKINVCMGYGQLWEIEKIWGVCYTRRMQNCVKSIVQTHQLIGQQRKRMRCNPVVLVYRCINGLAPLYFSSDLQRVADMESRRRLRSSSTSKLDATVHCWRSCPKRCAAARVWNGLPGMLPSPGYRVALDFPGAIDVPDVWNKFARRSPIND